MPVTLTASTTQTTSLPSSSSTSVFSPLFSESATSANTSPELAGRLPIRKRPRVTDLRHSQSPLTIPIDSTSAPNSQSKKEVALSYSPARGRTKRRCVSADNANRVSHWFSSPDRFVPCRSLPSPNSPVHLGRDVPNLTPRERYNRRRDGSVSPFRSASRSVSRSIATRRQISSNGQSSPPQYTPSFVHGSNALPQDTGRVAHRITVRQISDGSVWNVGGPTAAQIAPPTATEDGHGGLLSSGTNAPIYVAHFLDRDTPGQDLRRHEDRLGLALEIDPATRILSNIRPLPLSLRGDLADAGSYRWRDSAWTRGDYQQLTHPHPSPNRSVSAIPFRVLDAPRIRDDYYCSILAYSYTARTLAVAIGSHVYVWTEDGGVQNPPLMPFRLQNYVTSVSFSSTNGGHAILAVARQNGQVTLWSVLEDKARHDIRHDNSVSCVSFRPTITYRASAHTRLPNIACEDLLVGDDLGDVYYYSIEWPDAALRRLDPYWNNTVTALAKISAHSQQICGLAWSPDNKYFVTGGNDNAALLFHISKILKPDDERGRTRDRRIEHQDDPIRPTTYQQSSDVDLGRGWNRLSEDEVRLGNSVITISRRSPRLAVISNPQSRGQGFWLRESRSPRESHTLTHLRGMHSRIFHHSAAVKALAFAPWQPSLLATGGGSNDRQIHFFHTGTGAVLALINVFAQVTSLIWSTTKREICATFGYAQPEHKVRIAVFAWPSCDCVVTIPWESRILDREVPRALWAIRFPGRPNGRGQADARCRRDGDGNGNASVRRRESREGEVWASRTEEEGCIIVAGSDDSIKFHEVWAGEKRGGKTGQGLGCVRGVLGGSRILEGVFEGIDVEDFEEKESIR